jgi:hypothetical protein
MSLLDKVKATAKERRVKECKVFGEPVLCILHSKVSLQKVRQQFAKAMETDSAESVLAKQFLDPDTNKPFLTNKFLVEECAAADVDNLLDIFLKMNGSSTSSVEEAEKN